VRDIVDALGEMFPWELAGDTDGGALLVGSLESDVKSVLCSIELTGEVIDAGVTGGFDLLVTHHPNMFRDSPSPWDAGTPAGSLASRATANGLNIVACHANADAAAGGVADLMAARLGLRTTAPLEPSPWTYMAKVVVFVPPEEVETVSAAMADAGAGTIGEYTRCSFGTAGIGTFMPGAAARPYSGERGVLNREDEVRLEMTAPSFFVPAVVRAMIAAHPYEEVAHDVYRTEATPPWGIGRMGDLRQERTLKDIFDDLVDWSATRVAAMSGDTSREISRVAVVPGCADRLVGAALEKRCELLATGELNWHKTVEASEAGIALIRLGHLESERALVPAMVDGLASTGESRDWGLRIEGYRDKEGYWG
jgi:dinuclear metal center YbgI/SA1388 family protein